MQIRRVASLCVILVLGACQETESPVASSDAAADEAAPSWKTPQMAWPKPSLMRAGASTTLSGLYMVGTLGPPGEFRAFGTLGSVPTVLGIIQEVSSLVGFEALVDLSDGDFLPILPTAMNEQEVMVGTYMDLGPSLPALIARGSSGSLLQLPAGHGSGVAHAVGDGALPVVVGWTDAGGIEVPVRWDFDHDAGQYVVTALQPLSAANDWGAAYGINGRYIVGTSGYRAVYWDLETGAVTDAGFDGSLLDINSRGDVVGAGTDGDGRIGRVHNLTVLPGFAPGWINEAGYTLGTLSAGGVHLRLLSGAYLLISEVGVPAALAENMLAVGTPLPAGQGFVVGFDTGPDTDGDRVPDGLDNCPALRNPTQLDSDGDGTGDHCEYPYDAAITASADELTEGTRFTFTGSATELLGRRLTYTWAFSDGTTASGRIVHKRFDDNGSYQADMTASNAAGGATASYNVTVTNRIPTAVLSADPAAYTGTQFNLTLDISDRGAADQPFEYSVNWGDGSAPTIGTCNDASCSVPLVHTYSLTGTRELRIRAVVTDKDGGERRVYRDLTLNPGT